MKAFKLFISFLFSFFVFQNGFGQTYPVEALLRVTPPYSLYLSDYIAPGNDKLNVSLFLKDLTKTNYPVKLRLTIEGEGITIRTLDHITFDPIYINGGELLELTGSELSQYFNPKNLSFQGIDKNSYTKTNRLPEGIYKISIEALDINKKFAVSNKASHTAWFFLNNPPIWNLPAQNEIVKATFPQNVFFQWLPMNRTSLNSAFTTEYEFTLVEIYPINRNPNDAILSQSPIYQETTFNTSLVYNDMMPALIPGRRYVARLKAYDKGGLDLFKNNGYSEVLAFTFGDECKSPSMVKAEVLSPSRARVTWVPMLNHTDFVVRYRESGKTNAEWFEQSTNIAEFSINGLKANTEYEFQVKAFCESVSGDFSNNYKFKTLDKLKSEYDLSCGYNETPREITNFTPLLGTSPGNVFRVGKFDMEVTEVSGSNGVFSGAGNIFVPYLYATIKVEFERIKVNENYEVFEGQVKALKTGLSLLSASDLAQLAIEERRDFNKPICIPADEDKSNVDTSITFKPGDLVVDLGTIKIHKGDTITVNGEKVIADENTKFKSGDKVTVNGQEFTVGPSGDAKSTGNNSGSGTTAVSQQLGKEVKLNIKSILEEIEKENKTDKSTNSEAISNYADEIRAIILQEKLFKEIITGKDEELLKEGMSKKVTIPQENYGSTNDPITLIYGKHRNLYKSDSMLFRNKRKEFIVKQWLSKEEGKDQLEVRLDSLANLIIQDMSSLNAEQVKLFEEKGKDGNKALEDYIKDNLKKRLNSKTNEPIEGIGFKLNEIPNFLAYNNPYRGGYSLTPSNKHTSFKQSLVNDTASYISPAVRAHALHQIILVGDRKVGDMDPMNPIDLPIGLVQQKSGIDYIVAIENMVFTPKEAWFDAFMSTEVPQTGKKLAFAGSHVRFGPLGIIGAASVKLLLMKDIPMRLSNQIGLTIKSENAASFIEFDCEGFKSLSITGEFEFCEELLVPEDSEGEKKEGRVKAKFNATISDWNDLIAVVQIDPFQVKGLDGVGFHVREAVIDMSDRNNPASIIFPKDYNSSYFIDGNTKMWQGFYLREASVRLPRQFKDNTKQGTRIELGVRNLIIDNMGFTGELFAKGLIPKGNGDMDGWNYSLDSLAVGIQCNQIKYARFNGSMTIPAFKDDNEFIYTAIINPGNEYIFAVSPGKNLEMPLWKSKVDLYSSSQISVRLADGKFFPRAILNGKLTIGGGVDSDTSSGPKLSLVDISFERLEIASIKPYMQIGSFSFGSEKAEQKLAKFPVHIRNIGVIQKGNDVGIGFTVIVNLMSSADKGFGGEASLAVMGTLDERTSKKKWVFKSVDLGAASINIDQGAYKIWGSILFFKEDKIYGTGFKGNVGAEFKPGIKVQASALFGNVNDGRYWYADAMASFKSGIAVFPGFGIYGFGGGAYYRMKQQGFNEAGSSIGQSLSGIVYIPDPKTFLGIKASLYMGTHPSKEAFNGDATFEIAFNDLGGIHAISFDGNGYFVTPPLLADVSELKEKCKLISKVSPGLNDNLDKSTQKGQISASVHISYDVPNSTLHGNLKVFVNVGGGVMVGTGANNMAGDAVLHFAPDEWYIYIGTPDQRIGVQMLKMAKAESYLMVGTKIPGSPPPPSNVSTILGGIDLDYMRDLNQLGTGAGFAFGSSLSMNTGDLRFLMFYARFEAGLGFDIMLKNYGPEVQCAGRPGSLGINGWYANGQAYAYFQGKIGVVVDLAFYKGNYDIIDLGAAAVLQAKLPNPVWMRGTVGGYFSILNGLVKGNCKFQVTLGEECQIVGGSILGGIKVITEITPKTDEADVNVFTAPQAIFNMPIGKVFEITDMDGKVKAFRIKIDHFKLTSGKMELPGVIEWNDNQDVAAFKPYDILPSKTEVKVVVEVSFEEKVSGEWRPVFYNGKLITESKSASFNTGIAPDYIPASNIAYSYPIINQFNFYNNESEVGYIKLKQGMPHLFIVTLDWKQAARFKSDDGAIDLPYTYIDRQVNFKIPTELSLNKVYSFSLVNIPATVNKAVDDNVNAVETKTESDDVTITTKKAEGSLQNLQEKELYSLYFKSSKYSTFNSKLNSATISLGWRRQLFTGVHELGATITGDELFDLAEIQGTTEISPLIQFEAVLTDNNWYGNYIHPLLYQEYPMNNEIFIRWRQTNTLGMPPAKAIYIRQYPNDRLLETQDIASGNAELGTREAAFVYDLNFYMYKDYYDMQGQAANIYANKPVSSEKISYLLSTPYPIIRQGAYKVQLKYVMPGTGKINSIKEITINNPVTVSE